MLYILKENKYVLINQVINYNGKVIGIIVKKDDEENYIPCYPSSLIVDIGQGVIWIDEVVWKSYIKTRDFLIKVNKEYDG